MYVLYGENNANEQMSSKILFVTLCMVLVSNGKTLCTAKRISHVPVRLFSASAVKNNFFFRGKLGLNFLSATFWCHACVMCVCGREINNHGMFLTESETSFLCCRNMARSFFLPCYAKSSVCYVMWYWCTRCVCVSPPSSSKSTIATERRN